MSQKGQSTARTITAAVFGNALEWFDFILHSLLAATIYRLFFPAVDPMTSILIGFGTLGVTFVARPIGGLVLGIISDRVGREKTLYLTFLIMAVATGLTAVLPTYAAIGVAAPILLIICRSFQGFSAGGEFGNATAYLIENAPRGREGLFGSLQFASQGLATLAAALTVFSLSSVMTADSFEDWGWRIPFALGFLIGPVGLYIRAGLTSEKDGRPREIEFRNTVQSLILDHRKSMIAGTLLFAAAIVPNYVNTVYMPAFASGRHDFPMPELMGGVLVSSVLYTLLVPLSGFMSDRFGRHRLILWGAIGSALTFSAAHINFNMNPSVASFFALEALCAIPHAIMCGGAATYVLQNFPSTIRATGGGTGYNLAGVIFGGLTPFWLSLSEKLTGGGLAPLVYVLAALSLAILVMTRPHINLRAHVDA